MSNNAELLLSIDIPAKHQQFLREAREDTCNIRTLNLAMRTLTVLPW
jgi:hypothetical protein